jgi:hypothetical protein
MIKLLGNHQILTSNKHGKARLNFLPLLDSFYTKHGESITHFLFAHWNKILELPAYYDPITERYFAAPESQIQIMATEHFWEGVQRIDGSPLPSSCLVYPNATAEWIDKTLVIDRL